jgi:hypothetical protein
MWGVQTARNHQEHTGEGGVRSILENETKRNVGLGAGYGLVHGFGLWVNQEWE